MERISKVTSKGQVTVPRDIRELLGIKGGDQLVFVADRRGVRLRPAKKASRFDKFRGIGNLGVPSGREGVIHFVRGLRGE